MNRRLADYQGSNLPRFQTEAPDAQGLTGPVRSPLKAPLPGCGGMTAEQFCQQLLDTAQKLQALGAGVPAISGPVSAEGQLLLTLAQQLNIGQQMTFALQMAQAQVLQQISQNLSDIADGRKPSFPPPDGAAQFPVANTSGGGTGAPVSVAPSGQGGSTLVTLASYTMPEGYSGGAQSINFAVTPASSWSSIQWSVCINGVAQPNMDNIVLPNGTLAVMVAVGAGQTVSINATNLGTVPLLCVGSMIVWRGQQRGV